MRSTARQRIAIGALAALLLAGCYLGLDDGSGSVGIQLPSPNTIPGLSAAGSVRIFVTNGPSLLDVGDETPYAEFVLPGEGETLDAVSVGPVPAGSGYQVVIVFGDYLAGADGTETFVPIHYAVSTVFTVYAGQATSTNVMQPASSPFVPVAMSQTLGLELKGIVHDGTSIHTATSSRIYSAVSAPEDYESFILTAEATVPAGRSINTISLGAADTVGPTVWANTTSGVLPLTSGGTTFDDEFDAGSGIAETSILDSGAYVRAGDVYGYVQFNGGLSGVRDLTGGSGPEWLEPIDLSEVVAGQPVYDMMVYDDGVSIDAFFATKLGAFRMPESVLDPARNIDTAQKLFEASAFFQVTIDGTNATITHVAVGLSGDDTLYLGTPRGAVRVADMTQIGSVVNLPSTLVPGTERLIVKDMATAGTNVVILTNHFLVYSTDGGATFDRIPVYASSVGEPTGLFLSPGGIVLLSGSHGLAGVNISSL